MPLHRGRRHRRRSAFLPNSFAKDVLFVALSVIGAADVRRWGWLALVHRGSATSRSSPGRSRRCSSAAPRTWTCRWSATSRDRRAARAGWRSTSGSPSCSVRWWSAAVRAPHGLRYLHPVGFGALQRARGGRRRGRRRAARARRRRPQRRRLPRDLDARGKWRVQVALARRRAVAAAHRPPAAADARRPRRASSSSSAASSTSGAARAPAPAAPAAADRRPDRLADGVPRLLRRRAARGRRSATRGTRDRDGATPAPPPAVPPLRSLPRPAVRRAPARRDRDRLGRRRLASSPHRFAAAGRRVLVLERGPHADPAAFTDDEVGQYLGSTTRARSSSRRTFTLQVLQGMCVGGGTTINNGLCLPPPGPSSTTWEAAGIDRGRAASARSRDVRRWLGVRRSTSSGPRRPPRRFGARGRAARTCPADSRSWRRTSPRTAAAAATATSAAGSTRAPPRSTSILPWAQRDWPDASTCSPTSTSSASSTANGRATGVSRPPPRRRAVTLAADEIVSRPARSARARCCGAAGSAARRSATGCTSTSTRRSPPSSRTRSTRSTGSRCRTPTSPGDASPDYLVETWFNPPATQALATPGWFDRHYALMHRFRRLASAGVLVGTTDAGPRDRRARRVLLRAVRAGPRPRARGPRRRRADLPRGRRDARHAGHGRLSASSGRATTSPGCPTRSARSGDLLLTSAHPQGGNAIGTVVDGDFRVDGHRRTSTCATRARSRRACA